MVSRGENLLGWLFSPPGLTSPASSVHSEPEEQGSPSLLGRPHPPPGADQPQGGSAFKWGRSVLVWVCMGGRLCVCVSVRVAVQACVPFCVTLSEYTHLCLRVYMNVYVQGVSL